MNSILKSILITFTVSLTIINDSSAQTTISGGNVSGLWVKSGSPYKVNGNITVPNGQTLQIEPGVRIEFAQFKYMLVDGRILAQGGSSAGDSIWFTKQNPNDTGSWKGVKFIRTNNSNDTSIFKYCVFRNCKSLYDTALAFRSGGITILGYGKVKIESSTFYRNEANIGACIHLTVDAFVKVFNCKFKFNKVSMFGYNDGPFYSSYYPAGAAILVEYGSNALIDSCNFENQKRGKDYRRSPSTIFDGTVIDIQGSSYYKKKSFATITNSVFNGNEGIALRAYNRTDVRVRNCNFINAPANKLSLSLINVSADLTELYTYNCKMQGNQSSRLIDLEDGARYYSTGDLISNNYNFAVISTIYGSTTQASFTNSKILNNTPGISYSGEFMSTSLNSCLIANNSCPDFIQPAKMNNTTVVNNYCSYRLMLIANNQTTNIFKNNIIWNNKCDSANGRQIVISQNSNPAFLNNNIENDTNIFWPKNGPVNGVPSVYKDNIASDPKFNSPTSGIGAAYDAANADFSLVSTCNTFSPCINSGNKDTLGLKLPKLDIEGNARYFEDRIDMGCYEDISGSPLISIIMEPKSDSLCKGERTAELSVDAFGKGLNYQWQSSNNGNSWTDISGKTLNKLNLGYTNPQQNTLLYRALLKGNCDSDTSSAVHVLTYDLPKVNLGNDTEVCQNSRLLKTVANSGKILWHTGSTDSTMSQSIVKDSIWWCRIISPEGCQNRDTVKVKSLALPNVNLGADQNLHSLKKLELHAGAGQQSYLWNDQSTQESRSFFGRDLGAPGTYTIWAEVTNDKSCKSRDSINITVEDNSSVQTVALNSIVLYPQPASDFLYIELHTELTNAVYQIVSIDGKVITAGEINGNSVYCPISFMTSGVYMLRILNGGVVISYLKWVKL